MLLKPVILAAAGLTAATQAFLLPPEISQSDIDIVDSLPDVQVQTVPQHVSLNVSCPGCLSICKGKHSALDTASDKPNKPSHLEFDFWIDQTSEGDELVVNGYPLFPGRSGESFHHSFRAPVARDGHGRSAEKKLRRHPPRRFPPQELGYQLSTDLRALNAEDGGLALYEITLQVLKVGGVSVDGIPSVHIMVAMDIKTDALVLGGVTQSEPQPVFAVTEKEEECTTFMCKWLAIVKDNVAKLKGKPCHGKNRSHHGGHHHHKGRPHKAGGHRRHHSWGELLNNVVQHIVLPIAVGIVAGVSVSLVGMMVGTLTVTVWRTLFRRPSHRRSSHSRKHSHSQHNAPKAEVVVAEEEEKAGLVDHQESPPSYADEAVPTPPPYDDEATPKTGV